MSKANQLNLRRIALILAAAVLIAQLALVSRSFMEKRAPKDQAAARVPQFLVPHLENPALAITDQDLRLGRTVVLNFFASWCGPCEVEHPLLMNLAQTAPIIGVDHLDHAEDAARFLARLGNPYSAVGVDGDGKALAAFGFDSIPTTVVVNGDGNVLYVHRGRLKEADIDRDIRPLLTPPES